MHIRDKIENIYIYIYIPHTHTHTHTITASETNLSFKVSRMPDLPSELTKSMNKWRFAVLIVFRDEKKIPQWGNSH
jgi:hypothetical protein